MSGIVLLGLRILAALALYTFLGGILILLWRSLNQEALIISSIQISSIILQINSPDEAEYNIKYNKNKIMIGREPDCDCILPHTTVSGHHARLSFHHTQWWIEDLLSTNGTKLNDEPLIIPTVVVIGDTIKCGQVEITILNNSEEYLVSGAR